MLTRQRASGNSFIKGITWTWGTEQQKAFEQIKADLKRVPVLVLYDLKNETKMAADVLSYGLGGVGLPVGKNLFIQKALGFRCCEDVLLMA